MAGVATLMLDANPNLGWRDVQYILALSATRIGSADGATPGRFENDVWKFNNANDWIDGGAGFDTASYIAARTPVTVDVALTGAQFTGSEGTDTLVSIEAVRGGALGDTLSGDAAANALYGNAGDDRLDRRGGVDKLYGGASDDVMAMIVTCASPAAPIAP